LLINKINKCKGLFSCETTIYTRGALIFFALVLITIVNYGGATAWDCDTNCSRACGHDVFGRWVVEPTCKLACDSWINLNCRGIGPSLSEEAWGEGGRVAYVSGAEIMLARSPMGVPLNSRLKQALRPVFNDVVDRVRMHWDVEPLDRWARSNVADIERIGIDIGYPDTTGQTYGHDVFIRYSESSIDDSTRTQDRLHLLIHELQHVVQYEKWDSSLSNFGYHYFKKYKQANQSYENNEVEVEANQVADANIQGIYDRYESNSGNLSAVVLESSPSGSGTNWRIINNGGSFKIQNLGNSPYKDWYLDIDGQGGVVLESSPKGSGTNWLIH
jgi:hypothetical protein